MPRGNPDPLDIIIGENIRRYRRLRGVTQSRLGEIIGVSSQQLQKYETAMNRLPASRLTRIAEAFRVGLEVFFV